MISSIPSSAVNVAAPYAPQVRLPVSQETDELKQSTFKATEQLAESSRGLNRRLPDERPNDEAEQDRVYSGRADEPEGAQRELEERQQQELAQIQELAARDREVRAHEQAHAAVAGAHGGSPTYTFVRGPDGVSYAVGGEVSIDTSPIPGDPEATIRKAQQLQRAANAPADPSGQDRQVAAQAVRMEQEARAELREQQAIKAEPQDRAPAAETGRAEIKPESDTPESALREQELREQEEAARQREELRFEDEQRLLDQRRARAELFSQMGQRNIDINRRLVEMGVFESAASRGGFLNKTV